MKAADTNVVVRLIVADDKRQTTLAEKSLEQGLFISHGILMETEWVLRSRYRLGRREVASALRRVVGHPAVETPEPNLVDWALERHEGGADFADMLHLIAARDQAVFLTFEVDLARKAGADSPVQVESLT